MNKILFFVTIFLFCTALGLYVANTYIAEVGNTNPVTGQSVDDVSGSLYFLMVILIGTILILLVLKYYKGHLLYRLFEAYVIFVGSMVTLQVVLYDLLNAISFSAEQITFYAGVLTLLFSAAMVVIRMLRRTFFITNFTLAIVIAGVGGALGSFMGFIPALVLVLALGTYDIIAVFKTKHMLKLADGSRVRELPVMFETSSKGIKTGPRKGVNKEEDVLGLGTGDIAIPLIFFVGILRTFNDWALVIGAIVGALLGLGLTIYYVTQIKRMALPALPPIIGLSIIGFGASYLLCYMP